MIISGTAKELLIWCFWHLIIWCLGHGQLGTYAWCKIGRIITWTRKIGVLTPSYRHSVKCRPGERREKVKNGRKVVTQILSWKYNNLLNLEACPEILHYFAWQYNSLLKKWPFSLIFSLFIVMPLFLARNASVS